jgi:hypothetical protein
MSEAEYNPFYKSMERCDYDEIAYSYRAAQ